MRIYLIQPGENDSNELTDKGVIQIKLLARKLISNKIKISQIYVNGNNISRQTGELLSKAIEVPLISDERFSEVRRDVIFGNSYSSDIDNLKSINLFINEIFYRNEDVIITIGGGVHRVIISMLTGMPLEETRHFFFQNTGVSVLCYDNGTKKWRINSINDVNHLRIP